MELGDAIPGPAVFEHEEPAGIGAGVGRLALRDPEGDNRDRGLGVRVKCLITFEAVNVVELEGLDYRGVVAPVSEERQAGVEQFVEDGTEGVDPGYRVVPDEGSRADFGF